MFLKFIIFVILLGVVCGYPTKLDWLQDEVADINASLIECEPRCKPLNKPTELNYFLRTRRNPGEAERIIPLDLDSIRNSNFNPKNPTRFIAHGWNSGPGTAVDDLITAAYLTTGDFNVFFIDWTSCAKTINYFKSRCCVEDVGKQVAEFIDFLNDKFSLKFNNLALSGHSLGAHAMGFVGKNVKNGKVNTIVGLDAAKPCFVTDRAEERLADTDAEYVETIHTNGAGLGFMTPIGHASFYPNWGKTQNGCGSFPINLCSHSLSYEYYAESIVENNFVATKCDNYEDLLARECSDKTDIKMGGEPSNHKKAPKGIFYLPTNKNTPYGMG